MLITMVKFIMMIRRSKIYYYELDEEYIEAFHSYLYEPTFNYLLAAMSTRVFKLEEDSLLVVSGDQTYYNLDPKEATFIMLSAHPYNGKIFEYFDPGHA